MAPIFKPLALASALLAAISSAAPVDLNKREMDVVWTTVTTVVWTTVDVTTTIYPTPQAPTPPVVESTPTATPSPAPEQPKPIEASTQPETPEPQPAQPSVAAAAAAAPAVPAPEEPAPQPATPSTSTTTQAAPSASPAANSGNSGSTEKAVSSGYSGPCSKDSPCVGQLTYYDTATSASAPSSCGMTNDGFSENVVALPVGIMTDADCGKTVTITYNGITKTATAVDKCMGCKSTDLDASRHLFGELADFGAGRINGMSWYFN
ncbi:allergen Asp f 7 [Aspergillus lentulus]|uniref:Allergen Asp f 7 n=1 Tax=Aspergillus lentulus TaxID=293939 RepID=A0ABQ1AIH0_ASPLE|nr:allergen Asp f 7 [Aspergillus lentulus]